MEWRALGVGERWLRGRGDGMGACSSLTTSPAGRLGWAGLGWDRMGEVVVAMAWLLELELELSLSLAWSRVRLARTGKGDGDGFALPSRCRSCPLSRWKPRFDAPIGFDFLHPCRDLEPRENYSTGGGPGISSYLGWRGGGVGDCNVLY